MKKFLWIAMTTLFVLYGVVSSHASMDVAKRALKQLGDIRQGRNNQSQIVHLRVKETSTFGSNITVGADATITVGGGITVTGVITVVSNIAGANGESWDNITDGTVAERWDDTGSTNKGSRVYASDSVTTNSDDNSTFNHVMYQALNDSSETIDWFTIQPQIADNTTNTEDSTVRLFIQIGGTQTEVGRYDAGGFTAAGVDTTSGYQMNGIAGGTFAFTNYNGSAQTNIVYIDFVNGCSNVVVAAP